jgi:hypothetical protein
LHETKLPPLKLEVNVVALANKLEPEKLFSKLPLPLFRPAADLAVAVACVMEERHWKCDNLKPIELQRQTPVAPESSTYPREISDARAPKETVEGAP